MRIYTVLDAVAGVYSPPHTTHNDITAAREIRAALLSPDHPFAKNPRDFALFCIGEWDPDTGVITALSYPHVIMPVGSFATLGQDMPVGSFAHLSSYKEEIPNAS